MNALISHSFLYFLRSFRKCQTVISSILTSTSLSLCSREAASSSFFSSNACPSSAASIRSVSIPPPLSPLPGDVDEGSAKEREMEEDEERGKKESSRLGEGRLLFLGVNIVGSFWLLQVESIMEPCICNPHSNGRLVSSHGFFFSQKKNLFCEFVLVWGRVVGSRFSDIILCKSRSSQQCKFPKCWYPPLLLRKHCEPEIIVSEHLKQLYSLL